MPGAKRIKRRLCKQVELAISVDCGSSELLGGSFEAFKASKKTIAIDHHSVRKPYANICLIDKKAAAVGELVYVLLRGLKVNITKNIAQNILTSLIVETNAFRLPSVRPETFAVCAELLKTGVNFSKLSKAVYWSRRRQAMLLSAICILRLEFLNRQRIVWSIVKRSDFYKTGGDDEDLDFFPNDMLSIDTVEVAVFFREKNARKLRVSLRSKGKLNVALLARRFGGGGHFDAAGCLIQNSPVAMRKLLKAAAGMLAAKK